MVVPPIVNLLTVLFAPPPGLISPVIAQVPLIVPVPLKIPFASTLTALPEAIEPVTNKVPP